MHEFQVNKTDFTQTRIVNNPNITVDTPLKTNEIIVEIESFALTANNITYAVLGDKLGYWQFFPATDNDDKQWGIIPVWGFANVISSNSDEISVGEKLFGYFPPASLLKMQASNIKSQRFIDGSNHRKSLPPGYNVYRRVSTEPGYNPKFDVQRMLLFPLHITSYCLWDYLKDNNWFKADQIIIISASSKTSIGLAYGLNEDKTAPTVIGMTGNNNTEFVNKLGLYQQVISYNDIDKINKNIKTVIVDMSGNTQQLRKIEEHLEDNLQHCIQVGLTHWDEAQAESPFKDASSEMFFAPAHIQKRIAEWGAKAFENQSMNFMTNSAKHSANWLNFSHIKGLTAMSDTYKQVCNGHLSPEQGVIIKP